MWPPNRGFAFRGLRKAQFFSARRSSSSKSHSATAAFDPNTPLGRIRQRCPLWPWVIGPGSAHRNPFSPIRNLSCVQSAIGFGASLDHSLPRSLKQTSDCRLQLPAPTPLCLTAHLAISHHGPIKLIVDTICRPTLASATFLNQQWIHPANK